MYIRESVCEIERGRVCMREYAYERESMCVYGWVYK